ncbi:MFS transporter [Thiolinea disciformis]|uniref:MFS transporter n=1 Tax=Thiolinea disciformis TaxID=125614 RepID=UPI0003651D01|nr:MFS transporter [Thiolinea disciformis]
MIETNSSAFWQATLALCLGSFMIFANVYVTQPLLPMLAAHFGISALQAGWSFSITTLMLGVSLLFYGPLSDALGRRVLIISSMVGVMLCTFALSQVDNFTMLLALRALQGLCLGGLPAIAIAYLGDEFSRKAVAVAVGFYIAANTLGGIGGRLIGGFVSDSVWVKAFGLMAVINCFITIAVARLLPASQQFKAQALRPHQMLNDIQHHLRNPNLLIAYVMGGANFLIFITQYSYITFVLAKSPYNLPPRYIGLLFLTYLSGTLASLLSGRITQSISQPLAILLGISCFMLGSMTTLASSLTFIILGFLINSFGFFLAHSVLSSWVSRHALKARASASSLYLVFYYFGASLGGFYLEPFWHWLAWQGVIIGSLGLLSLSFIGGVVLYSKSLIKSYK